MGRKQAADKILSESGKAFDPEVAQALHDWAMSNVTQSDEDSDCPVDPITGSSTASDVIMDSTTRGVVLNNTPIPVRKSKTQ